MCAPVEHLIRHGWYIHAITFTFEGTHLTAGDEDPDCAKVGKDGMLPYKERNRDGHGYPRIQQPQVPLWDLEACGQLQTACLQRVRVHTVSWPLTR